MDLRIRQAEPRDAGPIAEVHAASIRGLAGTHYTRAEVEAWAQGIDPAMYREPSPDRVLLVAEQDGRVVGFAQLDPVAAEVMQLFVAPGSARRGIGRALMAALERSARERCGLGHLVLRASLNAVEFYEAVGFSFRQSTSYRTRGGLEIRCALMVKVLRACE